MSDIAIKVENLSKLYQLGSIGTGTLGNDLKRWWASTRGKEDPFAKIGQVNDRTRKAESDYVWALKDIDFEVKKGEVLGIIGRNGAGKSTLLKILSKITSPSTGKINVDGRIASLLEVGTGFHPELSGRENIFMNGAILGMRKWEIQKKFDEIVDFSGVEAYIDTPVKRYSSGMYVRLAFAVAAFLEPEILIVDEVLAVGDSEFQKKCLGRMKDVSVNEGRTVLFVSHNIEAVKVLCNKGLFLVNGAVANCGEIGEVCTLYLLQNSSVGDTEYIFKNDMSKEIVIEYAALFINGHRSNTYTNLDEIEVQLTVHANTDIIYSIELLLKDQNQVPVLFSPVGLITGYTQEIKSGHKKSIRLKLDLPFLASGRYYFDLMLVESGKQFHHYASNALFFNIEANYIKKTGWNFTQQSGQGNILLESVKIIED